MSLKSFIENNDILKEANEITFYGGSFNPWHAGHTSCLELAPSNIPIIVIPDHNPFKELIGHQNKSLCLETIQNTTSKLEKQIFIFDEFYKLDQKNPTNEWLGKIHKDFPSKNFNLLLGFDTYITLHKWIEVKKVLNSIKSLFVVYFENVVK